MAKFDYNKFKSGSYATTKIGKTIKFIAELRNGIILVAQEKYKGYGFNDNNCPADVLKYYKDGTRVGFPSVFNQLEMK